MCSNRTKKLHNVYVCIILHITASRGTFKPHLAEAVITHLEPIQKKYNEIISDEAYLEGILKDGQLAAEEVANDTLRKAKESMGFHIPR